MHVKVEQEHRERALRACSLVEDDRGGENHENRSNSRGRAGFRADGGATARSLHADPDEAPESIAAEQLTQTLQILNNDVFAAKSSTAMSVSELPGVPDGTPEAESATIEQERIAAMATEGPELSVTDTTMTIRETREVPAGRIVTMHTVRTLSEGTSWEELEPFLVVDRQGFPLGPGSFRYLNAEAEEDWSEFTGDTKDQAEMPEPEGTPASNTGLTAFSSSRKQRATVT